MSVTVGITTLRDLMGGTGPFDATILGLVMRGRNPAVRVDGDDVTFPYQFRVQITDSIPASFELSVLPADCYWKLDVLVIGSELRWDAVLPAGPGPIEFTDLVQVDPESALPVVVTPTLGDAFVSALVGDEDSLTQAAVDARATQVLADQKGAVSGVASLDGGGKLPEAQIPDRLSATSLIDAKLKNLRGMVPIATHAQTNVFAESNGTNTFTMTQVRHEVTGQIDSLAPVFANFKSVANGTAETVGSNDITVRSAALVPFDRAITSTNRPSGDANFFIAAPTYALTRWRVGDYVISAPGTAREEMLVISLINTGTGYITTTTNRAFASNAGDTVLIARAYPLYIRGARDAVLPPGSWAQTDPIAIDHPGPTDTYPYFWTRTLATCASAAKIPLNVIAHSTIFPADGVETGTSATDKTTSGIITPSTTATYGYGPVAVVGTTPRVSRLWAVRGDSVPTGQGDTLGDYGYMTRAFLAARKPLIKTSQGSERGAAAIGPGYRSALIDGATDVIWEYPTNDLFAGAGPLTALQCMSMALVAARQYAARGARFYMQTIVPRNTSTDSWATLANQTVNAGLTAERTTYNDWVRAGCPVNGTGQPVAAGTGGATPSPYVTGYLEVADTVENTRNDNKWKVNGAANYLTADGIHPAAAGHILMAVPVTALITA